MTFKEKAIAALEDLKGDCTGIIAATIEDCQRVIGDIPEDAGWISVTERLPRRYEKVLICSVIGNMYVAQHFNGSFYVDGLYIGTSHWMPLPKPPKEDN